MPYSSNSSLIKVTVDIKILLNLIEVGDRIDYQYLYKEHQSPHVISLYGDSKILTRGK